MIILVIIFGLVDYLIYSITISNNSIDYIG